VIVLYGSWQSLYRFGTKFDTCFSAERTMPECHRGRADPTRSSKRDERADDLTGTSEENKRKCLTEISTENRTICNGEEATGLLPISGLLALFVFCACFLQLWVLTALLYFFINFN
jgi:hypothetical protein